MAPHQYPNHTFYFGVVVLLVLFCIFLDFYNHVPLAEYFRIFGFSLGCFFLPEGIALRSDYVSPLKSCCFCYFYIYFLNQLFVVVRNKIFAKIN